MDFRGATRHFEDEKFDGPAEQIYEPKEGEPTLTVIVSGRFNYVAFERRVFGIKPEDLEECDLPRADEPLGSANMTIEEARAFLANAP